jgi:hypothetical protein
MTSESYLVRRAIYQRLHIEEMANRKTEISMGIQVEEIEAGKLNLEKKPVEGGQTDPAGKNHDSDDENS